MSSNVAEKLDTRTLDVRADFPALSQHVRGKPLVYLDSAASALKPQVVIDAIATFYATDYANIHRAVHTLSQRSTQAFDAARETARDFVGAKEARECVFVRGTTEAINLVAQAYARPRVGVGDEILVTGLEHHSNIVPWQLVCEQTGAKLVVAPIEETGEVLLSSVTERLSKQTKIVACAHVSNALGTLLPIREIAAAARAVGATTVIDGAQAAPHVPVDVQALGVDFYALSGHKLYGPSGIGVLFGRAELLEGMSPYQGGGDMIRTVAFEGSTFAEIPHKFEAGTPNIAGAVGLKAAMDYVSGIGFDAIRAHEQELMAYGTDALAAIPGLRLVGTAKDKVAVLSFVLDGIHPHDIGTAMDMEGVAVRTGHHCAQPVMGFLKLPATARASLGIYSNKDDIDRLVAAIGKVQEFFG